jgi:CRP/FNR family transcriptional regulator, nitrogen fixation regulation protein
VTIYTGPASTGADQVGPLLDMGLEQIVRPPSEPSFKSTQSLTQSGYALFFKPKRHVFHQGAPVQTIYQVESGVVFIYQLTKSGQRRIFDFYMSGDVFGVHLTAMYQSSCQASTEATVLVFEIEQLMQEAGANVQILERLRIHFLAEHERRQQHVVLLGLSASERVAGFILNMARRRDQTNVVDLPMTRRDIADYLALTVETVCRELKSLRQSRAIALDDVYRIRILNRAQLGLRAGLV